VIGQQSQKADNENGGNQRPAERGRLRLDRVLPGIELKQQLDGDKHQRRTGEQHRRSPRKELPHACPQRARQR